MDLSAPVVIDRMIEVYNDKIANNQPLERRLPVVKDKVKLFMELFSAKLEIKDLSGKAIVPAKEVETRYECVFRESGSGLRAETLKRFFFDAKPGRPTYCLDFEAHHDLVTPRPGQRFDGALGTIGPRKANLLVLYEVRECKVTGMWLAPDKANLGEDKKKSEAALLKDEALKPFFDKVKELRGSTKEAHFQNYLAIDTIG
jgi:hypothetical protein